MALDIFAQYATDETLEENGTWFQIGGGARVLVARSGNRKYGKMLTKEVERNKKALDLNDDAADKLSEEIMIAVIADTILLGWEDVSVQGQGAGVQRRQRQASCWRSRISARLLRSSLTTFPRSSSRRQRSREKPDGLPRLGIGVGRQ
jgi:hypothetical protein